MNCFVICILYGANFLHCKGISENFYKKIEKQRPDLGDNFEDFIDLIEYLNPQERVKLYERFKFVLAEQFIQTQWPQLNVAGFREQSKQILQGKPLSGIPASRRQVHSV